MSQFPVAPRRGGLPARPMVQGSDRDDYRYVEEVVRVGFPVRDARTYLARQMGNRVIYKLVESRRGERPGHVREAEIRSASGGPTIRVRAVRTLPDGTPASYFAPDDLVEMRTELSVDGGQALPPLQPQDRILLHVPVRSYLRFLPGIYRGGVPTQRRDVVRADERAMRQYGASDKVTTTAVQQHDADQFRRFLFIFQHLMTTVTERIDGIATLIDPTLADPRFLPWISSWVNFELDEGLPLHQQRELVRRSIRLHRTRGTSAGIEEMIAVLVGTRARVVERDKPAPCVLGAMTLSGGRTPVDRFLGGEPPAHYVVRPDRDATTFFVLMLADRETFGKEFGERAATNLRRIQQIVSNEMPGHVTFTIQFDESV